MKVERETSRAIATMNVVIELVNNNLYISNLISDFSPGKLSKEKELEHQCRQELERK